MANGSGRMCEYVLVGTATAILVRATSATTEAVLDRAQFQMKNQNARVLILRGTGRVGGSTAFALSKLCPDLQIVVGSGKRCGSCSSCSRAFSIGTEMHCIGICHGNQAYIDVCDDTSNSQPAKSFEVKAITANIPAVTSEGIYPGVSNGILDSWKVALEVKQSSWCQTCLALFPYL
ncbi:hypothetical protein CUMW_101750 [Citrus unshiu]|nr:hypothetical protein CUMW_101750 [Citrus unshiu]